MAGRLSGSFQACAAVPVLPSQWRSDLQDRQRADTGIFTPADVKRMADEFHRGDDPNATADVRAKRAAAIVERTIRNRIAEFEKAEANNRDD